MPERNRRQTDELLIVSLACGSTVEQAARKAGVGERTAYRRLSDPAFATRLKAMRDDMVQRSAGMLTAAALEAVKSLVKLLDNSPPAVRLGAARAIIEMGARLREMTELTQRITALENQSDTNSTERMAG